MIMANLTIELKTNSKAIDREYGRFISKDLANYLTQISNKEMMAFYPSTIKVYSIELMVEFIGNNWHHGPHINFIDVASSLHKQIIKYMPDLKDKINKVVLNELSFNEAAVKMLYCYKNDDYLIPDSDPATVMSLENMYERSEFLYNSRFMPYIKLWSDLVCGALTGFTGLILDDAVSFKQTSYHKMLEYSALSKPLVDKEVKTIKRGDSKKFHPFNKYYKILVSNRTMIPTTLYSLVDTLYKSNQLSTKAVYVIDLIHILTSYTNDNQFLAKLSVTLRELAGSTLVVFIDVPNHFIKSKETKVVETNALQLEDHEESITRNNNDQTFYDRMNTYGLLDIDDSLDWPIKVDLMRRFVTTVDKDTKNENPQLNYVMNMLINIVRNMNLVIAYTDTEAFNRDYGMVNFAKMMKALSISQVSLSNSDFTDDQLIFLGKASICEYYHISINSSIDITDNVNAIVSKRTNKHDGYSSLYGFRYLVRDTFEYVFQDDMNGKKYFSGFKTERKKKLEESENTTDEKEKQSIIDHYDNSSYGNIDSDFVFGSGYGETYNRTKNIFTPTTEVNTELDQMIGLIDIKKQVYRFANFVEINKIKESMGLKPIPISKHMVFMGNPGTAKTSVAIQLGKILHGKGLIPVPDVKWVSRDDLVGMYVGHSARHTKEAIEAAKGGILFVDEAYSLVTTEGGTNSYGQEVINTFVNYMDKPDIRDSTIIIFAGYKDEMKQLIDSNPGLKSRIGFYFDFPDYTTEELLEIAKIQASNSEYILEEGYLEKLKAKIEESKGAKDFGNGRFVRNIFEKAVLQQATRLANMKKEGLGTFSRSELITIKAEDFSIEGIDVWGSVKSIGFVSK